MDVHQTQMDDGTPQANAHRQPFHMGSLLVVASALLAFLVWTRPCWSTGIMVLSHFPLYWQEVTNRGAMISLLVRICSPLLVALLVRTMIALWATINPLLSFPDLEEESLEASLPGLNEADDFPLDEAIAQAAVSPAPAITSSPLMPEKGKLTSFPATPVALRKSSASLGGNQKAADMGHSYPSPSSIASAAPVPPAQTPETGTEVFMVTTQPALQASLPSITITLLKELRITLHDRQWQVEMPLKWNVRTLQLVAYIAWKREVRTRRGKLIEDIFGFGKGDEEATPKKLGEALNSAKKSIRAALREAAGKLNTEAGQEVIDPHLDLFALDNEEYWLSSKCQVTDLTAIEQSFRIIDPARDAALLEQDVQVACDTIIAAYQGDLLETLIKSSILEEPEWENHWLREPFTFYRDCFLSALWCRAEYLRTLGEQTATTSSLTHFEAAARAYQTYALHACNSRFDAKFRRGEAEQALRWALRMYARTGNTHAAGKLYQSFEEQVNTLFPEWDWKMSKKTEEAWRLVQQQTREFLPLPVSARTSD